MRFGKSICETMRRGDGRTVHDDEQPRTVQLFFATVNNRIGIKPAQPAARDAFPLAKKPADTATA
ncbi:MAG: hypothetical protein ACT4O9_00485 [Blastocatellia bacterium]